MCQNEKAIDGIVRKVRRVAASAGGSKGQEVRIVCFLVAALLTFLSLGWALYSNILRVDLFESQLLEHVQLEELGLSPDHVSRFAANTIHYLSGAQAEWNPSLTINIAGIPIPAEGFIPESFSQHMTTVKDGLKTARTLWIAGVFASLALLVRVMHFSRKRGKDGFRWGAYYLGMGIPLLLLGVIALWAALDFESLWRLIHQIFIPDGIFSAMEPVMQLFPVDLFAGYLPSIVGGFALLVGIVGILPLLLWLVVLWTDGRVNKAGKNSNAASKA